MKKLYIYIPLTILIVIIYTFSISCRKDDISNFGRLNFSTDTIFFDTIFTKSGKFINETYDVLAGSTTKQFKVYNKNGNDINIKSIYIERGDASDFRLNIDGFAQNQRNNIIIKAQDSMFVFVEVTLEKNNEDLPLIIEDNIVFETEDNTNKIKLIAWGQDANTLIYEPAINDITNDSVWTNEKPYLIAGNTWVDSGKTLTIEAGTIIHFYNYSSLVVFGTLIINGTKDNPVVFQGHRLDDIFEGYSYRELPGQWGTIAFMGPSKNNKINYAIIKNGIAGFQIDHPKDTLHKTQIDLTISNTVISNMSGTGIYAFNAIINAKNLVISNCANEALGLLMGGDYNFTHCTIANYWNNLKNVSNRKEPSVIVSNYINYIDTIIDNQIIYAYKEENLNQANFENCIIYGDLKNEIFLADTNTVDFNFAFNHCLIKIDDEYDTSDVRYNTIYTETDSLFIDTDEYNYELHKLSGAINKGSLTISNNVPLDFNGNNRLKDGKPDLGAFEIQ